MNEASTFLGMLEAFINSYLPTGLNASPNTIKSHKYAFRLLIEYMHSEKGICADRISFNDLDYDTVTGFLDWIGSVRKCSPSTKNQRLSALLSFSGYAQNRDFDAAAVFRAGIIRIPVRKAPHKSRSWFSREEMDILLSLPDDTRTTGLRKIRSIGLSNWYVEEMEEFLPQVNIMPALVQNEIHPYYQEQEVVPYMHEKGIVMEAWYPLGGRGYTAKLLGNEVISEIAAAHGKSAAQVILRWDLQNGVVVIPGSSNPDHIRENISIFDFELTDGEMEQIRQLDRNEKHDWY